MGIGGGEEGSGGGVMVEDGGGTPETGEFGDGDVDDISIAYKINQTIDI